MKRTSFLALAAIAICSLATLAPAQSTPPTQFETISTVRPGKSFALNTSTVVTQRVGYWSDLGGLSWLNLDLRGFGGWNITGGNAPTFGGLLSFDIPIKNGPTLHIGPAVSFTQPGYKPTGGAYFGLTFNFSK